MKKIVSFILCLVMVFTLTVPVYANNEEIDKCEDATLISSIATGSVGHITGIGVSLRTGAGTNYSRIGYVYKPDTFTVLGTATGSGYDWYRVTMSSGGMNNKTGYVAADYTTSGRSSLHWSVSASVANFRSGPGTSYGAYGTVSNGDSFYIIGNTYASDGQWFKVHMTSGSWSGSEGYLREDVVTYSY